MLSFVRLPRVPGGGCSSESARQRALSVHEGRSSPRETACLRSQSSLLPGAARVPPTPPRPVLSFCHFRRLALFTVSLRSVSLTDSISLSGCSLHLT